MFASLNIQTGLIWNDWKMTLFCIVESDLPSVWLKATNERPWPWCIHSNWSYFISHFFYYWSLTVKEFLFHVKDITKQKKIYIFSWILLPKGWFHDSEMRLLFETQALCKGNTLARVFTSTNKSWYLFFWLLTWSGQNWSHVFKTLHIV